MRNIIVIAVLLALIGIGGIFFINRTSSQSVPDSNTQENIKKETTQPSESINANTSPSFGNPKKSAHFESNTPAHGSILAGVPVNVVIDFNFDLAKPSKISIHKDSASGENFAVGETIIDSNKLSMRQAMDPKAPDGLYTVIYNACWPDGSCHDGNFQFKIDRSLAEKFEDKSSVNELTIKMSQIKFMPMELKIKIGTKVTWINDDSVTHYVNTDSHPAHTYQKDHNSKALEKGDKYEYTFSKSGIYPYHCSAHAENMTGNILVID